jgi:hypothetical protein
MNNLKFYKMLSKQLRTQFCANGVRKVGSLNKKGKDNEIKNRI